MVSWLWLWLRDTNWPSRLIGERCSRGTAHGRVSELARGDTANPGTWIRYTREAGSWDEQQQLSGSTWWWTRKANEEEEQQQPAASRSTEAARMSD